ncbi:hypothetical protein VKT23_002747 [Stygiomarasmius scandens]|uniref:Uncharacterized protein n=1 Tax=Marasmiellus scandens TaxID=2682957 RepID=A0ABR1JWL9_9AGAR
MSRLSTRLLVGFAALRVVVAQNLSDFDWTTIEPKTNFSWVDCYSGFQCARFQVPLNYSEPGAGSAAIAVIKLNATMENGLEYSGSVLTNPGGPGGSGIDFILGNGKTLQKTIGSQFDIVGFDPRGIAFSTPRVAVIQTAEERANWLAHSFSDLNSSSEALPETWAKFQAFGQAAQARDNGILDFVTTGNVARDMLGMIEAMGQEKIQYYGLSYGTALGATFATIFPDRVGRMILDGCVDTDGYFSGSDDFLSITISDADKAMQAFFDGCHAAGPEACPFYASSSSEIAANLDAIYDSLRSQPVPVFTGDTFGILTYDSLRQAVFNAVSSPYTQFKALATGLAELSNGNGTTIFQMIFDATDAAVDEIQAFVAIFCSDTDLPDPTISDLQEAMAAINSTFAGVFALPARTGCAGWKFHPGDRFRGPVGANTSNPLLLIGNTADPRTPLVSAKKTSSMFPGSAVLIQDSPGVHIIFYTACLIEKLTSSLEQHTSEVASSNCTSQHIGAYFATGELPAEGTVCQVDEQLFPRDN